MTEFDGLHLHLGNLSRLSSARTRSISAENKDGAKGKGGMATTGTGEGPARELGIGWKVSPSVIVPKGGTIVLADIAGPGAIQHIWLTCHPSLWRKLVLRMYWDGEETPSVEAPIGDFFCNGWCERADVNSIPVAVNPAGGFNSYWLMPFRRSALITVESLANEDETLFYQIDYTLTNVGSDEAYFHAQFRRSNPLAYQAAHTIIDGIAGRGHYVGTYLAWQSNNAGWWGEGEIKFFMDGDGEFPTICGTGTEDYVGGAWCFEQPQGRYATYSTPYLGFHQVLQPDGFYRSQTRFGMYRWHVQDPIRFESDLKVTIQALGWRSEGRYLPLQDDIASTAFWYQAEPHAQFPTLPDRNDLEVI